MQDTNDACWLELKLCWRTPFERAAEGSSADVHYWACDAWRHAKSPRSQVQAEHDKHAKIFAFFFWSWTKIIWHSLRRQQKAVQILAGSLELTHLEKYAVLVTGMQISLLVQSLYFRADCFMIPHPADCAPSRDDWHAKLVPSLEVLVVSVVGTCSAALARLFKRLFRKRIVGRAAKHRRDLQRCAWKCEGVVGWSSVFAINVGVICVLLVFASTFNTVLVDKWLQSAFFSIGHRFTLSPVIRGVVVGVFVIATKHTRFCDLCAARYRWLLPVD